MPWNRRHAIRSYVRSSLRIAPVPALLLFRTTNALQFDYGWILGFGFHGDGLGGAAPA